MARLERRIANPNLTTGWPDFKTEWGEGFNTKCELVRLTGIAFDSMANNANACDRRDRQRDNEDDAMSGHMVAALDNLANAAVKKNTSLESLVAANKMLTEEIALMSLTITTLLLLGTPSNGTGGTRGNSTGGDGNGAAAPSWDLTGYCWSHGYKVRCSHSSTTCER